MTRIKIRLIIFKQRSENNSMKKILVIGAKGMLGQELVKTFSADNNFEVFGWDREEINIASEEQVKDKIGALAPKIIVNAAAYNAADKAEEPAEFELAKELNGLAPGYLAREAKRLGAVLVHYSTDYVFDGQKEEGYREADPPSPISNYGWSKLLGEKQIQEAGGHYYLIRLQKLFGWPAQSISAKKSFFYQMLSLAKNRLALPPDQRKLEVVDEELGNFTYAPDLAARTRWLLGSGQPGGLYHITNEGAPATWYGAAEILFEVAGLDGLRLIPVPADKFPRPARRPKYSVLLNTKLAPLRPWPEALKEFLGGNR